MSLGFRNSITISKRILKKHVKRGDIVVDATCGNGLDTLFLAELVGETGKVYAFDIQGQAIQNTFSLIGKHQLIDTVVIIKDNHSRMTDHLLGFKPQIFMFNLGYMPGADHNIITRPDSTIEALKKTLDILAEGGLVIIVFYTGHPGGEEEYEAVHNYLSELPQSIFEVLELEFINQVNKPPGLILIHKISEGKI